MFSNANRVGAPGVLATPDRVLRLAAINSVPFYVFRRAA
jgi:hypothetical protein